MIRLAKRKDHFSAMKAAVKDGQAFAASQTPASPPDVVVQWLGSLMSLQGVPFSYLVPDEGMLPPESIRFFQVDANWLYALVEGATSVGRSSSAVQAHDAAYGRMLHTAGMKAARLKRGTPSSVNDGDGPPVISGFLLRSAVVSGWPGLEVAAFDSNMGALPLYRMDLISPSMLLYMVTGSIAYVNIYEPPEGLHFGVEESGGKLLRYVTVPSSKEGVVPGDTIDVAPVTVNYRGPGVLKINALATALSAGLQANDANNDPNTNNPRPFTSAEFAVQMVEGTQSVFFQNQPATPSSAVVTG
jgi:hypothetical protein